MSDSQNTVDAARVADMIEAELPVAVRRLGLGESRSIVLLTRGTWPVIVTTSTRHHEGLSVAIEQKPYASMDPAVHAQAAINLICALLDEEAPRSGSPDSGLRPDSRT